jgi:Fic family protein
MRRDDLASAVRERLVRYPPPRDSHYGVVPLAPPEHSVSLGSAVARHQAATEALSRIQTYAAELRDPFVVSRLLARREAITSSAIEGTFSTLDALLSAEETTDESVSTETRQVRDYAEALEHLLPRAASQGRQIFTLELVKELHRTVVRGDTAYPDVPGEFRSTVVWIGGGDIAYSTYNPAPPADIPRCLDETVAYMRGEGMQMMHQSLFTRMAIAHAHFEAVHPFRDGNGRVGRLLLPLMMTAEGHVALYLSPYIEAHKIGYYDALKAAQQRLDWGWMTGFVCDAVIGTVDEMMTTRAGLSALREIWQSRRPFRSRSAALRALDFLPHYPVITVNRLAALLGVTFRAAAQGIEQLVEAGILAERTGYRRNRVFAADEALRIINRPFGAEPLLPTEED